LHGYCIEEGLFAAAAAAAAAAAVILATHIGTTMAAACFVFSSDGLPSLLIDVHNNTLHLQGLTTRVIHY
jgi:hypothetical protein